MAQVPILTLNIVDRGNRGCWAILSASALADVDTGLAVTRTAETIAKEIGLATRGPKGRTSRRCQTH